MIGARYPAATLSRPIDLEPLSTAAAVPKAFIQERHVLWPSVSTILLLRHVDLVPQVSWSPVVGMKPVVGRVSRACCRVCVDHPPQISIHWPHQGLGLRPHL